jgi:uncharacterized delta-60 repeat protein
MTITTDQDVSSLAHANGLSECNRNAITAANGTLDATFSGDGQLTCDDGSGDTCGVALAIDADVNIDIALASASADLEVVRFDGGASVDSSLGSSGLASASFSSGVTTSAMRLNSDGKIVIVGFSSGNFSVLRFNADGSADTSFDTDGKVTTEFGNLDIAYRLTIGPDYKITVVGETQVDGPLCRCPLQSQQQPGTASLCRHRRQSQRHLHRRRIRSRQRALRLRPTMRIRCSQLWIYCVAVNWSRKSKSSLIQIIPTNTGSDFLIFEVSRKGMAVLGRNIFELILRGSQS